MRRCMTVMRLGSHAGKCLLHHGLSLSHLYLRARVDECHMLFVSRTAAQNMFGLKWFRPARERQVSATIRAGDKPYNVFLFRFYVSSSRAAEHHGDDDTSLDNSKEHDDAELFDQYHKREQKRKDKARPWR